MSETALPTPDPMHADVGIVYATNIEIGPFFDRCERMRRYTGGDFTFRGAYLGPIRIAAVQCGMGSSRARRATGALIDAHSPRWVVSTGFSGALQADLKVGDVVVGNSVVGPQGSELTIDIAMSSDPSRGLHVGRLVTADHVVRSVAEKEALGSAHQALAVDMESLAVAEMCREARTRCLVVRAISDDMSKDLPAEILTLVGGTGSVRLGAAVGAIWRRPGSVKEMWRLREQASIAADRLARFLDGVIGQLYAADH